MLKKIENDENPSSFLAWPVELRYDCS